MLRLAIIPIAAGLVVASALNYAGAVGIGAPLASSDPASIYAAAERRLASEPLDPHSYYALALRAEGAGDDTQARRLMDQALEIAPRLRAVRLWLLQRAAVAGDVPEVVAQARVLARLSPRTIPEVSEILAQLAASPQYRRLIAERFANEPLIIATAGRAARQGLSADAILELLAPTDLAGLPNGVEQAQALVARALLAEERPAEARRIWLRIGKHPEGDEVFDGSFAGLAGGPPFGWTLGAGANIEAAIEAGMGPAGGGALRVQTFSSLALDVAEQTLALAPGPHRLGFTASSDNPSNVERTFVWTITCAPRTRLFELELAPTTEWSQQTGTFLVPEDCPVQVLRLAKLRTPDQRARSVSVSGVSIDPA